MVLFAEVVALRGEEAEHPELMAMASAVLAAGLVCITSSRA